MPPDRVFGNIKIKIKKYPTIMKPEMLIEVIKKFSKILYSPECVTVYNFRATMSKIVLNVSSWPFQISKIHCIVVTKSTQKFDFL